MANFGDTQSMRSADPQPPSYESVVRFPRVFGNNKIWPADVDGANQVASALTVPATAPDVDDTQGAFVVDVPYRDPALVRVPEDVESCGEKACKLFGFLLLSAVPMAIGATVIESTEDTSSMYYFIPAFVTVVCWCTMLTGCFND